jgi:hypothetical protein
VPAAAASLDHLDRAIDGQQQRDEQDNSGSEQHRHGHFPSRRHRNIPNAQ